MLLVFTYVLIVCGVNPAVKSFHPLIGELDDEVIRLHQVGIEVGIDCVARSVIAIAETELRGDVAEALHGVVTRH